MELAKKNSSGINKYTKQSKLSRSEKPFLRSQVQARAAISHRQVHRNYEIKSAHKSPIKALKSQEDERNTAGAKENRKAECIRVGTKRAKLAITIQQICRHSIESGSAGAHHTPQSERPPINVSNAVNRRTRRTRNRRRPLTKVSWALAGGHCGWELNLGGAPTPTAR
jgi:5'-3' exonuclease